MISFFISTLSSGQNAVAAVILKDILQPNYQQIYGRSMSDNMSVILAKICSKQFDIITCLLYFFKSQAIYLVICIILLFYMCCSISDSTKAIIITLVTLFITLVYLNA